MRKKINSGYHLACDCGGSLKLSTRKKTLLRDSEKGYLIAINEMVCSSCGRQILLPYANVHHDLYLKYIHEIESDYR